MSATPTPADPARWPLDPRLLVAGVSCVAAAVLLPLLRHHALVDLKAYRIGGLALAGNPAT